MNDSPVYSEWQLPNFSSFLPHLLLVPATWATLAPFDPNIGLLLGFALMVLTVALRFLVAKRIILTPQGLQIGAAMLPLSVLGEVDVIAKQDQFFARGALAHPNTFFALKSGLPGMVRVHIEDTADPTPYALVATRNPEELAKAIRTLTSVYGNTPAKNKNSKK